MTVSTKPDFLETSIKRSSDLATVYTIPFQLDGTVYFWLWDNGDFILWDNGDRMRQ